MRILGIADDLTGALETGAQLADHGIRATVFTRASETPDAASVVNANTRHMAGPAAAAAISAILRPAAHVYLKTDSTLRGPSAQSIAAVLDAFPDRKVLYAPAYPALGRTVKQGRLLIDGVPLERTEFTRDPLNPVREGSIVGMLSRVLGREVISGAPHRVCELLHQPGSRIVVSDGETGDDLDEAAAQAKASGIPIVAAGPAGFVGPWARMLDVERSLRASPPPAHSGIIVSGSRHPRSRAQVRHAIRRGVPAVFLDPARPVDEVVTLARQHDWLIIETPETNCGDPLRIASRCGDIVAAVAQSSARDALVIFGGDTALAVTDALGCRTALPYGELLPGAPVSRIGGERGYTLVTKAGGFGEENVIDEILKRLEGD